MMTVRYPELNSDGLNIDLWPLAGRHVLRLLDSVTVDCFLHYTYRVLLGREPNMSEMSHHRPMLVKGMARQLVVDNLLKSKEYADQQSADRRYSLPIDEFISKCYIDILGRWPDEEGRQTYTRLAALEGGRARVESDILGSSEAMGAGWGRVGRTRVLKDYARQARILSLPLIGIWFRRSNELLTRLATVEVMLGRRGLADAVPYSGAPPIFPSVPEVPPPPSHSMLETITHGPHATSENPAMAVTSTLIETVDPTISKTLEKDGWVFRISSRRKVAGP